MERNGDTSALRMNLSPVAAEVTRRTFLSHSAFRLLTSAATNFETPSILLPPSFRQSRGETGQSLEAGRTSESEVVVFALRKPAPRSAVRCLATSRRCPPPSARNRQLETSNLNLETLFPAGRASSRVVSGSAVISTASCLAVFVTPARRRRSRRDAFHPRPILLPMNPKSESPKEARNPNSETIHTGERRSATMSRPSAILRTSSIGLRISFEPRISVFGICVSVGRASPRAGTTSSSQSWGQNDEARSGCKISVSR